MPQRDSFYEESAVSVKARSEAKFYTVCNVLSYLFLVFACIGLFFSFSYVASALQNTEGIALAFSLVEWFGLIVVLIGIFLAFFFLKKRFNLSYDYTFVEDELRISKVFNGKKRKFLYRLAADHIIKIGWVKNDSFDRTCAGLGKKDVIFLSPNREPAPGKEFYYFLYTTSMGKKVYVLEARQELLEYVVRAAGINKLERK